MNEEILTAIESQEQVQPQPPRREFPSAPSQPTLFNRKDPFYFVKQEKPHHRYMLHLAAQGFTVKEIAEQTGFTPVAVNNILRQPHAQALLVDEISRHSTRDEEVFELVTKQVTSAVKVLASIMNDEEARGSDRISAARELLDRKYGKPNQPVTHKETVDLDSLSDAELAALLPKAAETVTSTS